MNSRVCVVALCSVFAGIGLQAQTLSGPALVKALHQGGYVVLMRHASSPREKPDFRSADPGNLNGERQLDDLGKLNAEALGKALKHLKVPIGEVFTSPTYRAIQTARLANLSSPRPQAELGENGPNMQAATEAQAAWLQKKVTEFPSGTNTILITHLPNITKAFPQLAPPPEDGEAIIFGPDGKGGATVVARIKIDEWPKMKG
ncbi:MAG TPA: histidine phosphatase family protein [Bryobacteraceae bacterium]|jgi:phosphohistidine phosphatase SixA|nr:histidine phosphatase family protein [Bryobacteraceae bacterium]